MSRYGSWRIHNAGTGAVIVKRRQRAAGPFIEVFRSGAVKGAWVFRVSEPEWPIYSRGARGQVLAPTDRQPRDVWVGWASGRNAARAAARAFPALHVYVFSYRGWAR